MASIFKRKTNGTTVWRAVVSIKGYPTVCNASKKPKTGPQTSRGKSKPVEFKFDQHNKIHTSAELVDRYIQERAQHHRSSEDTLRHLNYWKTRLGAYGLVHITPELARNRNSSSTPLQIKVSRTAATTNRYMYNTFSPMPHSNSDGSVKILPPAPHETQRKPWPRPGPRLLAASRKSKSPYLYCVVPFSHLLQGPAKAKFSA